ncbi:MAG: hypothetical protein DRN15_01345 [Thermoprotei archaeon]|nr:MAG: hypothetical protein DRM97_05090 [Thermoprotei archaeon]RLF24907.1 MAG: hypothetical protein DRN15_01345 [Thermoprotei archaeon]
MPWNCPNCGYTDIPDDEAKCPVCGYVKAVEEAPTPAPQPAPQPPEEEEEVKPEEVAPPAPAPPVKIGKAKMIVVSCPVPEFKGKEFELDLELFPSITIGRSPESVITIPDPYISRLHAKIVKEGDSLYIEDLGSTNGTYVYDKDEGKYRQIKKEPISDGALFKLGVATVVKFVIEQG